jgi:hypothetical protein
MSSCELSVASEENVVARNSELGTRNDLCFKDEAMKKIFFGIVMIGLFSGCEDLSTMPGMSWLAPKKPYGYEAQLYLPGVHRQVWAIAPAINISGQSQIDPLLQSDLVYSELQKVRGVTVIPVDRVAEVYASLHIDRVESEQQAYDICKLLGCDGLVIPTVTAYDPYDPPKFGASIQLFARPGTFARMPMVNTHELERSPTTSAMAMPSMPEARNMAQVVEMYDASDGSVLDAVKRYAHGRTDPNGPLKEQEIIVSMDRYCAFGYHELLDELIRGLSIANAS